jgi:hypothetical protein
MRYVCLIYNSADVDGRLAPAEGNALIRSHFSFDETLRQTGALVHADALEPSDRASVVRLRNGSASWTDGPYVETKEHLAGLYLIEAADEDAARSTAAGIPSARFGAVELRPVRLLTLDE